MKPTRRTHSFSVLLAVLLTACGGGSGSGERTVSVAIDAPAEGARIIGSRTVVVTGTVSEGAAVRISTNGGAEVEASVSGGTFSATLTLDPRENLVAARATKASGAATATANVFYPFLSLRTFQDASVVIGQPDFHATDEAVFSRDSRGSPGSDGSQLYLPDYGHIRVYSGVPTSNGTAPSFTLAELSAGSALPVSLRTPVPLAHDGKLLIADTRLNRIFIVDALPSADGVAISVIIGQGSDCTRSGIDSPTSAFAVGGKLLVVDSSHHRILVWNRMPTSSEQPPDLVLGQPDFTTCEARNSASGVRYPGSVWSDGKRLLITDTYNNRILGWNTFPTENDQAADFVLGQPDFTSNDRGVSQGSLYYPSYLTSNGNQFFVVDRLNSRVLVWNTMPSGTGAPPDVVLGQGDFVHGTSNDADQNGTEDATPSANTLHNPFGVLALDDALVVGDSTNARYLVFRSE